MYTGGGKGKNPSAYQNTNRSDSRSSTSEDEDVDQLLRDERRIGGQSIQKLGGKGSDYSNSSENDSYDDIEADDGEPSINRRIGPQTYETEDAFVVDENGNSMKQTVHVVGASSKGSLNSDHLKEVYNLINPNSTSFQTFVGPKRKKIHSEIIKQKTQDLNIENNFERDLYNCTISNEILPSAIEWIFATCFKSRTHTDSDEHMNDEDEDETNEIKAQKRILEKILNTMLSEPDEDENLSVIYTPQYIIKHKSDIFKMAKSIYTNDDIFTILANLKRYKWLYYQFLTFESIQNFYQNFEPNLKLYIEDIISSSVSNELINDMTRFNSYNDTSENSGGAQTIYSQQKKLFKELVDEFLLIPEKVAYKLYLSMLTTTDHAESIDPPEPTLPPDVRLESFLESNDEYRELLETEINAGKNNYDDDNFDMHKEMINRLKEQIIRYASTDLSINPIFLSAIRDQIIENVVVRTYPTERGENSSTMLPYGKYGPVKRLKEKMISSFHHTDVWLLIKEAEEKGFLTVEIDYNQGIQQFLEALKKKYYLSQYGSQWDDLRQTIMDRAFKNSIWPQFKRETEQELYQKAAESVRDDVEAELTKKITAPPYTKLSPPTSGIQTQVGVTVLSLCYHPDIPNEIGVALVDPMGNVTSHFVENSYMLRNQLRPDQVAEMMRNEKGSKKGSQNRHNQVRIDEKLSIQQKAEYDGKKHIIQTIETAKPDIITICATHLKSRELFMVAQNLVYAAAIPHEQIKVLFAPSDAALIYARSRASEMERLDLSQQQQVSETVLIAASTARRVQNPLSELTRLCTQEKNYLVKLPLHRFQSQFLNEQTETGIIYEACELACIKAVAISGVDVSKLHSMHHRGALQFLPGFGPKFAEFILKKFTSTSADKRSIRSRLDLKFDMDECPRISDNAISFLRFPGQIKKVKIDDRDDQSKGSTNKEKLLDGTMIDITEYPIAYDVIKYFSKNENGGHKYNPETEIDEKKIRQFFMSPHHEIPTDKHLDFINSDFYSIHHDDMECHHLIKFIAKELNIGPFETLRFKKRKRSTDLYKQISPQLERNGMFRIHDSLLKFNYYVRSIIESPNNFYCPMTDVELFDALVNDPSIKEHSVSEFRILKYNQNDNSCLARTQNSDVDAVATDQFTAFSEDKDIQHIREKLFPGAILQIDKSQMKLVVSFNQSELENMKNFDKLTPYIDNNFDFEGEAEAQKKRKEAEKNKPHRYFLRLIEDEHFRNKTPEQAEIELMTLPVGDYIIRPSTRATNNDRLSLMIKFPGKNYGIYEIIERGKKGKFDLTLGNKLSIDSNEYDDLEEIQWNFVQHIQEKLAKIVQHRKYVEDFDTAFNQITADRQANPKSIPYRITNDPNIKSCVSFIWLYKDGTLVQEPIRLTPNEYRYRHQSFSSLDKIINHWKENKCRLPTEEEMKTFRLQRLLTDAEEEKKKEAEEKNNQTVRSYGAI